MRVIGTAGHVDHGKSTLVHALTGIDPDRLEEEKRREMTIDLGFAWLTLPDGEPVGVIDVPGHIDFIKNMLAGVGGIDAALFVIAADEGVMPQTREHLAILDLLQVPAGVVVLSKVDMVQDDPEWLELVEAEVMEVLDGSALADAPIVPVSARTGQGLPELLAVLGQVLDTVPERSDLGRPRLPVDRAFSAAGFGTIVTGTLSDGVLVTGQEVEIVPRGLTARIRGLQTHKHKIEQAVPGSRVAVNLSGVSREQIERGDVIALPGSLMPTILVDVHFRLLADAPRPLLHNQPVTLFTGASEVEAHTRLLDREQLQAGESGWLQLRLAQPVAVRRGDRFILRQPSPSRTLGGGQVVNPYPGRRWRRFRPEVLEMLQVFLSGNASDVLWQVLRRREPTGYAQVAKASGLLQADLQAAFLELVAAGRLLVLDRDWQPPAEPVSGLSQRIASLQSLITDQGWREYRERIEALLNTHHSQYPLRQGMPREELKSRLQGRRRKGWPLRLFNDLVAAAASAGILAEEGATVRAAGHAAHLSPQQQSTVDQWLAQFRANPYTPPSVSDTLAAVGEEIFLWLVESGQLVRVSEDVAFDAQAYQALLDQIIAHLKDQGSITVAQVRDRFSTSRKYALALMEHLDSKRITRRVGDARVLGRGEARC